MLVAAFAASFLPAQFGFLAGAVFLLGGISLCAMFKKFGAAKLFCFAAATGMIFVSAQLHFSYYPQKALGGLSAKITGRVTEFSYSDGKPCYTVKTDSVSAEGAPQKIKLLLTSWSEKEYADVDDEISCDVTFFTFPEEKLTDLIFDRSRGREVYAGMDSPIEVTGHSRHFAEAALRSLRENISQSIRKNFKGDFAPLTKKLLFGMGEAPEAVKDSFRAAGMSHILAVSGMHLVIIMGLFENLLFRKSKKPGGETVKIIVMAALAAVYMALCGFAVSVMRAGFMLMAGYFARLLWARSAPIDNLGISVIIILLIDPLAACDAGFLMSVLASGGIILFSAPLYEWAARKIKIRRGRKVVLKIVGAFAVSLSAWVCTLPVSVLAFGGASVVSPLSNIFAGPMAEGAVIFGILSVLVSALPFLAPAAAKLALVAQFFEGALLYIAKVFSSLPFAYVFMDEPWMKIWLLGAVLLLTLPFAKKGNLRYLKHGALMAVFALLCGILCSRLLYAGTVKTKVAALKNGTCISAERDGSSIVLARGLCYDDYYKMRKNGKRVDVFISLDADTSPIEKTLQKEYSPKASFLSETGGDEILSSGGRLEFWNGASLRMISKSAVEIDTGGILILYIFEECDIMDIEPRFRKADVIILDGISPKDYTELRCRYMILREQTGFFSGAEELIVLDEGETTFTSRGRNIKRGWTFG